MAEIRACSIHANALLAPPPKQPKPPFPEQHLEGVGLEKNLRPRPRYEAESYREVRREEPDGPAGATGGARTGVRFPRVECGLVLRDRHGAAGDGRGNDAGMRVGARQPLDQRFGHPALRAASLGDDQADAGSSRARFPMIASSARRVAATSDAATPRTARRLTSSASGTSFRLSARPAGVRNT